MNKILVIIFFEISLISSRNLRKKAQKKQVLSRLKMRIHGWLIAFTTPDFVFFP